LIVSKPAIVPVDDDPVVAAAITRDLRSRYSDNYRAVRALLLEGSGEIEARALVVVGEGAMSVYFVHRYLTTV
jgi:hypothetical protein